MKNTEFQSNVFKTQKKKIKKVSQHPLTSGELKIPFFFGLYSERPQNKGKLQS